MDIGFSDDMYRSFIIYQGKMAREFERMKTPYSTPKTNPKPAPITRERVRARRIDRSACMCIATD